VRARGEWVPRSREWRRDALYRGDGEGFIVHGEKRGAIGDLLEKVFSHFIPYMTIFWYWGGDREAAEVALSPWSKMWAIGDLLEKVFSHSIPYMTIFLVLGGGLGSC
jgi:hypothetical protein